MKRVINGKLYNTETATEIATDKYWDGSNWDRHGRTTTLYKTPKGNYFSYFETRWQGERDSLTVVEIEEAKEIYEALPEHKVEYLEAFGKEPEVA